MPHPRGVSILLLFCTGNKVMQQLEQAQRSARFQGGAGHNWQVAVRAQMREDAKGQPSPTSARRPAHIPGCSLTLVAEQLTATDELKPGARAKLRCLTPSFICM